MDCTDSEGEVTTSVVPEKWVIDDELLCPRTSVEEEFASKNYHDPDPDKWQHLSCKKRKTFGEILFV